jgi:sugar transferase (PEP-CTERM system associated)
MNVTESLPALSSIGLKRGPLTPLKRRVLILGSGQLASDLSRVLREKRFGMTEISGLIDRDRSRPGVIGTYDQLFEIVEHCQVQTIVVCLEDRRTVLPVQTLLDFKALGLEVIDGHHLFEEESGRLSIDLLHPSALIFSTGFRRRFVTMTFKRILDLLISVSGLVALAPFFLVIGSLIKLDTLGPIFYRQMRVGWRGQPYMIWKFRSMSADAEKGGPRWADTRDPRITRIGRWLRKLRIDELPQLINVLKGEMSLVGPRPERPVFVQELREKIPYYDIRHTVRPGITGWAQTQFRYGASAEDSHVKLQYDLYYVKNFSLALDLRILANTARVVLFGEGAR